ncbi:MAG: sulfite exporter TauE/SafE family protein [Caldilineaceae bacterium]|nr:sulfite exporter TauE/SafE family protein [Caldilineaceae bacterium]
MVPGSLPSIELIILILIVAFLYASVGFGGASGYLAAMSLYALSTKLMASTSLVLNIVVAAIAFVAYWKEGYYRPRLLLPFLLASVPAAFLGGYIEVTETLYRTLLYIALSYVGIRLLFFDRFHEQRAEQPVHAPWLWMLLSGALIGLISGILGLGGGIFLAPVIIFSGWGTPKEAATSSAGFIVVNSISSILGRLIGGNFVFGVYGALLLPAALIGGLLGARLGSHYLSGPAMRRLLGIILLLGVVQYFLAQ